MGLTPPAWSELLSIISVSVVRPNTPDVDILARWRVDEFADVVGGDFEAERESLESFTAHPAQHVALLARRDGAPAGTCLLVPSEIDPLHDVTPWLAGL